MSVLTDKNILVIGEENSQIHNLEDILRAHGTIIHSYTCGSVTTEKIEKLKIDLIFLNYLHEGDACVKMLSDLKAADLSKNVPVFMLVDENDDKIQSALSLGAADYVTPNETTLSIVQKMKTIFGEGRDFSGRSVIDITPIQAPVTSKGIKVYVVEDDPLLRNLLSLRFDKASFPYEFSTDGRDVIPAIKQFKPNVVILDLMLPGKSGFEVLAEIKSDNDIKGIPVIVFSNRDGQDDRKKATELGAVGFYVKAMTDLSELIVTIESHVK